VILHVVLWEAGSHAPPVNIAGESIPQIVVQHQLAEPLETLYDEIDLESYPHSATGHGGRCAATLQELPVEALGSLLDAAGDERFATKTRRYARWIHRVGAKQAFYEAWMEALGYKSNKASFRLLAQRVPVGCWEVETSRNAARSPIAAILFGVAGFLPTTASRDAYTKRLWSKWWKLRPEFEERTLLTDAWRFNGIRPANHPHRRLGAAVALLKKHGDKSLEKILGALESDGEPAKLFTQLHDNYWDVHFTLGGKIQRRATELIGAARAREIVTNVVLPFAAAIAERESDAKLRIQVAERYRSLRAAPSNSVLRLAGQQLFSTSPAAAKRIRTARQQQGLMQIFHDFCLNDKTACRQCQFPELARSWATANGV
jgi:hypothetical protein